MLQWLSNKFRREPNLYIGGKENPYLLRWHLIPRNSFFNIYLHKIVQDDSDEALHDHPYWSMSIVLRGGYYEIARHVRYEFSQIYAELTVEEYHTRKWNGQGRIIFRRATTAHRIELSRKV